jgi:hypothetical protein
MQVVRAFVAFVQVTNSVRIVLKDRGWKEAGKKKKCHLDLRTYRFKESEYNEANAKDDLKLNHFPRTSDITQKVPMVSMDVWCCCRNPRMIFHERTFALRKSMGLLCCVCVCVCMC